MCKTSFLLCALALAAVLSQPVASFPAEAEPETSFRFESGADTWRPRSASIEVSREEGDGAVSGSAAHLRVQGRIAEGWNYAACEPRPIRPNQLYRFTAWVRVDKLGSTTPPPYLKCEFTGEPRKSLGQVHTTHYEPSRLGQWQQLEVEFQAPEQARTCWLALEKGTSSSAEIDARLDEIELRPIARLSVIDRYRLEPLPAKLAAARGVHPRLYLNAAKIAELRRAIGTTHAELWRELRDLADRAVKRGPPAYREDDGHSGDEQLWQREVGNTMPVLAMAYALSGQRQYLESAKAWALASCGYKTWGLGRIDGMDLAAGHQLFGLGIVYDWCHADLDEDARRTIRETIVRRGSAMFEAGATGKAWWGKSYMQNHLWVDACGLSVAGLAVVDEVDDADLWIGFGLDKFRRTTDALGTDGASHEGVGYWEYGVEYLLKFMHLARELLGVDLYQHPWWRQTAEYPLYLSLPRRAWTRSNSIVDIADCPRSHWYGPDYLLRGLAREYRDGHAQWLADQVDRADIAAPGASWLNLVWYDPAVNPAPPDDLPTLRHFDDLGIVSARTGWSGAESLAVLKCGPFLGHKAVEEFFYDPGGGHVHPDANHFVLFGAGEWLIRDDGYRAKWTGQHNTLLVDGRGQLGEGKQWFDGSRPLAVKSRPRILRAASTPALDHIVGEAAAAYPADLAIESYRRHLLFLKPDVVIVADEIRTTTTRELELRFHPESQDCRREGEAYVCAGKAATLRIEPLTAEAVHVEAAPLEVEGRQGEKGQTMFTVRLIRKAGAWRNAVAFSWSGSESPPRQVTFESKGSAAVFTCGRRQVTLDWATGEAAETPIR
ncbi:MAG: DUF4962 domain-containing protein [Thermoguttaceae bacterium]|jgi:hypothetical protein